MAEHQSSRSKVVGRKFYEQLGSPKVIVAPMVDRSEFVGVKLSGVLTSLTIVDRRGGS